MKTTRWRRTKLTGRRIAGGTAQGEALVTTEQISFQGGVNPVDGIVKEKRHELEGKCVTGKVLVFPRGKGSSEGTLKLYDMSVRGTSPAAIINIETEPVIAVGAILGRIPTVDKLDRDPIKAIKNRDLVKVSADKGIVEILDRPKQTRNS